MDVIAMNVAIVQNTVSVKWRYATVIPKREGLHPQVNTTGVSLTVALATNKNSMTGKKSARKSLPSVTDSRVGLRGALHSSIRDTVIYLGYKYNWTENCNTVTLKPHIPTQQEREQNREPYISTASGRVYRSKNSGSVQILCKCGRWMFEEMGQHRTMCWFCQEGYE